jgi:hypothetical protein
MKRLRVQSHVAPFFLLLLSAGQVKRRTRALTRRGANPRANTQQCCSMNEFTLR